MGTTLYEGERHKQQPDPDELPIRHRQLFTQPYDLNVRSLMSEIDAKTLHLRPLSERPRFQRQYVWSNRLASLLIESILLNIPIPPCYFVQNDDFELSVIDGQQRIYSIFRFLQNQFALTGLRVFSDLNGKRFHDLSRRSQRQIETHTLRAVIITNKSDPEIQFDVFERLNTYTMPLNAQELRNCIYRGKLNDLLSTLAEHKPWLNILGRTRPDKRLRDEELILRFFAFHIKGLASYHTPQKRWLNAVAKQGKSYTDEQLSELEHVWKRAIDKCLLLFPAQDCFRRPDRGAKRQVVNRALMDLIMTTMAQTRRAIVQRKATAFRRQFELLLHDEEFQDLISRSIDHKSRTLRRFEIWNERLVEQVF
ncbi:MAG: DUF262 domain-containing protein [Gemmatimonadetes bacterium]|nr:DUF262 domain-containing protein [Gemmatimonadales bacterium]MYJ37913.1 DUF262 domain-containing protein [Gemmatimonadota bacterium]